MAKFNRSDFLLSSQKPATGNTSDFIEFSEFNFKSTEKYCLKEKNSQKCILIGQVYSSKKPDWSIDEIAEDITSADSTKDLIEKIHHLAGRFVVILSIDGETFVVGDAMGQFEVYFNDDCSVIASSIDLIGSCIDLKKHSGEWAELYTQITKTTRIQIGKTTKYHGVQHLMPNHLIDVKRKSQVRFYPTKADFSSKLGLNEGTQILADELSRFARSIAKVPHLAMPVTGGNDSRILLGAFKGMKFRTFVFDHPDSDRAKKDIDLSKRILKTQNRALEVILYDKVIDQEGEKFYSNPATAPRIESKTYIWNAYHKYLSNHVILFGHGGEIGRSFFKNIQNVTAKKLAVIMGYPGNKVVEGEMQKWLDELEPFILDSENLMDLFYWEQRMGNWGARIITEISYVTDIFSPMNARSVLETMLRVPKKHRQFAGNDLARKLITNLDHNLLSIPINPSFKYRIFWWMIRLRIYDLYQNARLTLIANRS